MGFRGSTETLDREIAQLEAIIRIRLRRYAHEMLDLDRDLRALRSERARRRARGENATGSPVEATFEQATS
jgi:hypothetical protein